MRQKTFVILLLLANSLGMVAQRPMDKLGRELVAQNTLGGVFLSWRILGEEYYDVTYNVYRDGVRLNSEPLMVSNFTDATGTATSQYTVSAVVRGVEQPQCQSVTPWTAGYKEVTLQKVYSRRGADITDMYSPNDICCADLDGDGELEILLKRVNETDDAALYPVANDSAYTVLEAYRQDGTRLWWIDCGPNMVSMRDVETNIVAYDWDQDGRAEVILRGADNMYIHQADGTVTLVGKSNINTRSNVNHYENATYTNTGSEYLLYLNGLTGSPYQVIDYPLPRGNASDWGDAYGHRSSKHFFGAPFLDGRHPSIFLARGIYTKHAMVALDVNAATHTLTERWRWNSPSSGEWYGQGYHNFGIADVDWDGRDEIVYGSMVIDDNGYGLSTSGLGHGDAQHCSDLDPFRHGQEIFACLEDAMGCDYRDATTSKLYFRLHASDDDGRCMAGNFSNNFIGSQLVSARSGGMYSSVSDQKVSSGYDGVNLNFRCYWDGDLLEETFNYGAMDDSGWQYGVNPGIAKQGSWSFIKTFTGARTNNSTKGSPCFMGDILGDWRDEFILRDANGNLRIYSTTFPTDHRIYTTWHDHQYRQGMVWQMCGYNQPPHLSYFLGEAESITIAPPPLTTNGRVTVSDGSAIGTTTDHLLICETGDAAFTIADGAAPYMLTVNTPTWVQGHTNNNNITTTTYTHTLTGGAFSGTMRLVKQGDGILQLPNVTETYTGETNIWAGTLAFDGTMQGSPVWLNRFAILSGNGTYQQPVTIEYAAQLQPGGKDKAGSTTLNTLTQQFGARIVVDLFADGTCDVLNISEWNISKSTWENGPQYSLPVIEFVAHPAEGSTVLPGNTYVIAHCPMMNAAVDDFVVEGLSAQKYTLAYTDGMLTLTIGDMRGSTDIFWTGSEGNTWDLASTGNFVTTDGQTTTFVTGDNVVFDDEAQQFTVQIGQQLEPDTVFICNETKDYTFKGDGGIGGSAVLIKEGAATATINNVNTYTGGTIIRGGTLKVKQLADTEHETGALGSKPTSAEQFVIENDAKLQLTGTANVNFDITIGEGGGCIESNNNFVMSGRLTGRGQTLRKRGSGMLNIETKGSLAKLVVEAGALGLGDAAAQWGFATHTTPADTICLAGGTLQDPDNSYTYNDSQFVIEAREKTKSTWNLDARCDYKNKVVGSGQITINSHGYPRTYLYTDWSEFTGTIVCEGGLQLANNKGMPRGTLNLNGTWISNNGQRFHIGRITGTGGLGGISNGLTGTANTWVIGNDEDFSWAGTVSANSNFEKVGSGKVSLTGASDHTGTTKVQEGELHISGSATLGTGVLTVAKGAILTGVTGSHSALTNSSTIVNGTVQVGALDNSVTGVMDFGGKNVTFNVGSQLILGARKGATNTNNGCASITGIGKLKMNGMLTIFLTASSIFAAGDSIRVWETEKFEGTPTLDLPALADGLYWDTADFLTTGLLRITDAPTAISQIVNCKSANSKYYDLQGRQIVNRKSVNGKSKHGVYIRRSGNSSKKILNK